MREFTQNTEISYYSINSRFLLTQSTMMMLFQDVAIRHSDALGYPLTLLAKDNKGWAITNWHIVIDRFPQCREHVTIKTWSSSCKRMQAERSYVMVDSEGKEIIKATARWVFIDLEQRKPTAVTKKMEEDYYCGVPSIIVGEKYRLPKADEKNFTLEFCDVVRRSETDTNGHTNNTKYVAWAMDMIPDEIYDNLRNYDIGVVYRKECYKGSHVTARTYVKKENGITEVNTYFLDGNDTSSVLCQVVTLWA